MAMPQRDNVIEEIKRLDALLEYAVEHGDDAEVLHDDGVRVHAVEFGEHFRCFRDLAFLDERVQRHVELPAVFVRVADHPRHFVRREVAGAFAGVESLGPGVYGVGPRVVCGEGAGGVSRGREEFGFVRHEVFHNENNIAREPEKGNSTA